MSVNSTLVVAAKNVEPQFPYLGYHALTGCVVLFIDSAGGGLGRGVIVHGSPIDGYRAGYVGNWSLAGYAPLPPGSTVTFEQT